MDQNRPGSNDNEGRTPYSPEQQNRSFINGCSHFWGWGVENGRHQNMPNAGDEYSKPRRQGTQSKELCRACCQIDEGDFHFISDFY